jgi:two-component system cell cycle sensor histidine kinase PleC
VENQFTKTKSGSGLGLAISKSLVELHGGSLAIESEERRGTTVTVLLPRVAVQALPAA